MTHAEFTNEKQPANNRGKPELSSLSDSLIRDTAETRSPRLHLESIQQDFKPSSAQRERYSNSLDQFMNTLTKSLPVRQGEQYSDVLARMFPKMREQELKMLSHDVSSLNNDKPLEAGQRFDVLSNYGKNLLKDRLMKDFEKNRPETSGESRIRSKFSPAYEQAMKIFAEKIAKAAAAETRLTRSEILPPSTQRFIQL